MSPRLRYPIVFFSVLLIAGTLGYMMIEGWTTLDALYMTVITLSTVGFGELRPLSDAGRLFTSLLILLGVISLAYTIQITMATLIERRLIYRRRMQMEIKRLSGHVVLCGYGRMGRTVCSQLRARNHPLVVVERDTEICQELERQGILHVEGDATDDRVLIDAGLARSSALATVLREDADNLFVTLSARALNPQLTIVARASIAKNEPKMLAAGATRVLNPYRNGGRLMAQQLLQPTVTDFFDVITGREDTGLVLEEVQLLPESPLVGVQLSQAPIRKEMDLIVVGIRHHTDQLLRFNPAHDTAPQAGDVLVVLGHRDNLVLLENLASGKV